MYREENLKVIREQLKKIMEDIEYNREHNLDNTSNYELYTQLSDELDYIYDVDDIYDMY